MKLQVRASRLAPSVVFGVMDTHILNGNVADAGALAVRRLLQIAQNMLAGTHRDVEVLLFAKMIIGVNKRMADQ